MSHLPTILGPESSSTFCMIQIILLYWGWYFLQRRFILQCCPTACSKSPWNIHIHQWPRLHMVSGLGQKWGGGLSGEGSMPQWMHGYLINLLLLEQFRLPEFLLICLYSVIILVLLLIYGMLLLRFRSVIWFCIKSEWNVLVTVTIFSLLSDSYSN